MKPSKQLKPTKQPAPASSIKKALLGLYGIVGISVSTFGLFRVPFAEDNAREHWRHALAGIIIFLLLIAAIVSFALFIFDANYFKSQIVDYVKTNNQRDLTLEGDIKVTFFPKLGLDSGKMSLSQRNSNKGFASIENARLYIAWWPLLRKQLQIERVELDGVHANVTRYRNGSTNFDDLLTTGSTLGDVKFEIDRIKLKNSSVNLTEEATGTIFALHDMDMETGKMTDSTPADMHASFRLESARPRIDAKVKLDSHVLFELKTNHYEFANFEGEMEGEAVGINNLTLIFQGTVNSYPTMKTLTVDKFSASAKGKLENRKLDTKLDISKLQLINSKLTGNTIAFTTSLVQDEENLTATLELPAFEMNNKILQTENIAASFDLFQAGRTLQGKLNSPFSLNLDTMQMQLPAIVSSFSATHPALASKLTANVTGNIQADFTEENAKLTFKAKIDDSNFAGILGLQDFAHPAYSFDLGVNTLDLDRYLATDWAKRFQDDALPFDVSGLKNLNLHGKLRSNEFKFAKLMAHNLFAEIKTDQATLSIEPLNARLYNGTTQGSFSITAGEIPKITFRQKLNGIQINALLSDIIPGEAKLVGKGNLTLDLNATGSTMGALRKTLNGNASLALGRGSMAGINLAEALVAGKEKLGMKDGERSDAAKFTETTAFAEFKSTFDINDGNARSNDFLMKSALFTSKGKGEIALDSGLLNYRLNTTVAAHLKRNSNGELADLKSINIPIKVTGPYSTPTVTFDFGAASGGNMAKLAKANMAKAASTPPAAAGKPAQK